MTPLPLVLILLFSLLSPSWVQASEDTRQASRTILLRQATGSTTGQNLDAGTPGYRAYVESVLDITTDGPSSVTNREFATPEPAAPVLEDPYLTSLQPSNPEKIPGKIESQLQMKSEMQRPAQERVRSREDQFQTEREKAAKDFEERQRQAEEDAVRFRAALEAEKTSAPESASSTLRPSLANNPFYFSQDSGTSYAETKTLMVSRLVQRGYTRLEAESLLSHTSSPEEAILALMQREGFNYGDATEVVSVTPSQSAGALNTPTEEPSSEEG